jgi:hypothetical protein
MCHFDRQKPLRRIASQTPFPRARRPLLHMRKSSANGIFRPIRVELEKF